MNADSTSTDGQHGELMAIAGRLSRAGVDNRLKTSSTGLIHYASTALYGSDVPWYSSPRVSQITQARLQSEGWSAVLHHCIGQPLGAA